MHKVRSKVVKMPFGEFLREHKRLDRVLKTKTRKDDAAERKKQRAEVKEYKKELGNG